MKCGVLAYKNVNVVKFLFKAGCRMVLVGIICHVNVTVMPSERPEM